MATYTTNYNLKKPAYSDTADIADINSNMDTIDTKIHDNAQAITGKVSTSAIKNNLTTTSSGYVLDARQGKALDDAKANNGGAWTTSITVNSSHALVAIGNSFLVTVWLTSDTGINIMVLYVTTNNTLNVHRKSGNNSLTFGSDASQTTYTITRLAANKFTVGYTNGTSVNGFAAVSLKN